jgi:hypothetical protein
MPASTLEPWPLRRQHMAPRCAQCSPVRLASCSVSSSAFPPPSAHTANMHVLPVVMCPPASERCVRIDCCSCDLRTHRASIRRAPPASCGSAAQRSATSSSCLLTDPFVVASNCKARILQAGSYPEGDGGGREDARVVIICRTVCGAGDSTDGPADTCARAEAQKRRRWWSLRKYTTRRRARSGCKHG